MSTELSHARRQEAVINLAMRDGAMYGIGALTVSGAAMGYAATHVVNFNRRFGKSVMAGLPIMVGVFVFAVASESTLFDANQNPEKYGIEKHDVASGPVKHYHLSPFKILANQFVGQYHFTQFFFLSKLPQLTWILFTCV